MRLRWPVYSYQCDECGHTIRHWQKPWFKPYVPTPLQRRMGVLWSEQVIANAHTGWSVDSSVLEEGSVVFIPSVSVYAGMTPAAPFHDALVDTQES